MLPAVALFPRVQPHHHLDHPFSSSHGLPFSYKSLSLELPPRDSDSYSTGQHYRSQLPHPVQHHFASHPAVNQKPRPKNEHVLRRKTPSGTLAAGYDATPGDSAVQPPAAKHILVSSNPPQTFAARPDRWRYPILEGPSNDLTRGNTVMQNPTCWSHSLNYLDANQPPLIQQPPPPPPPRQQQQQQQRVFLPNVPYAPTVLPASVQPNMGPTSSTGTGPYGPYWPDGAYNPYPPAALCDPRFDTRLDQRPNPNPLHTAQCDAAFLWNQGWGMVDNQEHMLPPESYTPRQRAVVNDNQHGPLPYHARAHPLPWSPPITLRTEGPEFKEKILSWAHGVYVDLLAAIHRARRTSFASGVTSDARVLKPAIYPKPPRQPGFDPSPQGGGQDVSRYSSTYPASQCDHSMSVDNLYNPFFGRQSAPGHTSVVGSFPGHSNLVNDNSMTAVNAASAALEMLSHLCVESGGEWIDGLLLGGCLAYGLGDYHKAMRWYSRILAQDERCVFSCS